ncbi:Mrpl8 [Kluyveromyces lactis]|nr:Mrpl8 [Kluyveromyces lactis]
MTRGLARHLSRTKPHRDALIRNMATQLLQHGTISSTTPKLKETQRYVERIITIAKNGIQSGNPSSSVPELQSRLYLSGDNSKLLKKLFDEIAPRYTARNGGYTRVMKLEPRLGDRAPQGILELVDAPVQNEDGQLLKGNLKLWLLTKTCMQQIEDAGQLAPKTVQNLKKMVHNKTLDQLLHEIGVIRKYILESQQQNSTTEVSELPEFDETLQQQFLAAVKEQIQNHTAEKKQPDGYVFRERPSQR